MLSAGISYTLYQPQQLTEFRQANAFAENWGQTIFQSANEMANNQMMRKRIDEIQSQVSAEKDWWEKRKATIQSDFMKELDDDAKAKEEKEKAERKNSDDDAVLVESGGPASTPGGGQGKSGKKKGKK